MILNRYLKERRTLRFSESARLSTAIGINAQGGNSLPTVPNRTTHERWDCIQKAVIGLFERKKLANNEMSKLHEHVRRLLTTSVGPFLDDLYNTRLLPKGMAILLSTIQLGNGRVRLHNLEAIWWEFYMEILPMLQAILLQVKTKRLTIRQTALVAFRDLVVLKLDLEGPLNNAKSDVQYGIKHMLLILQGIFDTYPPNQNKLDLESLVARVISPYLGFRGLYKGSVMPEIPSNEPAIAERRRSSDARRLSRPLSIQPYHMDTLEQLFKSAVARNAHESSV